MAAEKLTMNRIEELRDGSGIKQDEWDQLFLLAKDQLAQVTARDHNVEALRASLVEETARLEKIARLYSETQQALAGRSRDLAATDNYVQSLVRRLQDSLAKERAIREWQKEFEWSVQKCIDREELGPVAGLNPTLLRLQEVLEPEVAEAAPAE